MRCVSLIVGVLLSIVGCSPDVEYDAGDDGLLDGVTSIMALKESYVGDLQLITSDIVVSGVITANNILGEFEDSIVIEDDSGAIEIALDQSEGVGRYLLGSRLTLVCSGLYIGSSGGTLILGSAPGVDDYIVGAIDEDSMLLRATVEAEDAVKSPRVVKITELVPAYASCYVAIEDVVIDASTTGGTVCDRDPDTGRFVSATHWATDSDGNAIKIYVPSTVSYADISITTSETTLYGIVDLYNGYYSLRLICGYLSLMNL